LDGSFSPPATGFEGTQHKLIKCFIGKNKIEKEAHLNKKIKAFCI
jgi:hypothetical protein